ncbi:MAG: hypothetical protein HXY20_08995 [Acidobacteria bacterium]|nr:hypothetical protein [Acidobacteriota bacterium]
MHSLETLVEHAVQVEGVRKSDVRSGDWVLVDTRNSLYSIYVLGGGLYSVSGGWFDRKGLAPATLTINGCTWGGRAIKADMVAAPGLCLEFGNDIVTTRIQRIRLIRGRAGGRKPH